MATIYFSKREFRNDMQQYWSTSRVHAVCRKLVATVDPPRGEKRPHGRSLSAWYGAHYWAACWELRSPNNWSYTEEEAKRRFIVELIGGDGCRNRPKWADSLWSLALKRVREVAEEAKALKTSLLW